MKQRFEESRELLGSKIKLVVCDTDSQKVSVLAAIAQAFMECERIEQQFSRFLPTSELSLVNGKIGKQVQISEELSLLLRFSEQIKVATNGAFDISVQSILAGWGYDADYSLHEKAEGQTGNYTLDVEKNIVTLSAPIDLGALGKGYALDRMLPYFAEFPNILLDAGGDLYARGTDENDKPWKILFEHPTNINQAIGEVEVENMFCAASSPSRRKWRERHHLVHPQSKAPASQMLMTYVQADKGIVADALSTALFVLGLERAQKLLPNLGVEAMLIGSDGKILRSKGFRGKLYTAEA